MSEITLRMTVPVLEELAKRDSEFVVRLSHAAAKEIGERYGEAILQSKIVQSALTSLDESIKKAQETAGSLIESKVGAWDDSVWGGYRLRDTVKIYIERSFEGILRQQFETWLAANDINQIIDRLAKDFVEKKLSELLKKGLGEFLKTKWG